MATSTYTSTSSELEKRTYALTVESWIRRAYFLYMPQVKYSTGSSCRRDGRANTAKHSGKDTSLSRVQATYPSPTQEYINCKWKRTGGGTRSNQLWHPKVTALPTSNDQLSQVIPPQSRLRFLAGKNHYLSTWTQMSLENVSFSPKRKPFQLFFFLNLLRFQKYFGVLEHWITLYSKKRKVASYRLRFARDAYKKRH